MGHIVTKIKQKGPWLRAESGMRLRPPFVTLRSSQEIQQMTPGFFLLHRLEIYWVFWSLDLPIAFLASPDCEDQH